MRPYTRKPALLGIEARAFVRHAFSCFYQDCSKVDTLDHAFTPVHTFRRMLDNLRDAVSCAVYGDRRVTIKL